MCIKRIVVRIEISTLSNPDGKFNHQKMDRLAMLLSNLNNSGMQLILVSSGAIALGSDKLNLDSQPETYEDMQAVAAIGQAELIRFYQRYFDQYNQIVAQVLLTSDILDTEIRRQNTQNTFNTLLGMNIIPIVNENDTVSTSDIELDDNYPLAMNVALITKADVILIKMDQNSKFVIQPRLPLKARMVNDDLQLYSQLEDTFAELDKLKEVHDHFPASVDQIWNK
ncbi:MAG: glutamate 5-kinase [Bacteroidales bacterium]|nr:glutamate 5-kinase [Bacteroidales bacterium]